MHISEPLWKTTNDAKIVRGMKLYVGPGGSEILVEGQGRCGPPLQL